MNNSSKEVFLDPVDYLNNYKNGFNMPISRNIHSEYSYNAQKAIIKVIENNRSTSKALRIYSYEFLRELLIIFQWDLVKNESQKLKLSPRFTNNFKFAKAIYENDKINLPNTTINRLKRGLKSPNEILLLLRSIRDLFDHSIMPRRRLKHINMNNSIVAFTKDSFMETIAQKNTTLKVYRCSPWEWFRKPPKPEELILTDDIINLINELLSEIKSLYSDYNIKLEDNCVTYLKNILEEALPVVNYYYQYGKKHLPIPKVFWFGSTNNIYTRIVRQIVEDNNGKNVGFDHGRGMGMQINKNEMGIVFDLCNDYYSYSQKLSDSLENIKDNIYDLLPNKDQEINFLSDPKVYLPKPNIKNDAKYTTNRIMYVSGLFKGEGVSGANCLAADSILIDWQYRLAKSLKELNFNVAYKGHPESKIVPDKLICEKLDLDLIEGKMEDTWNLADTYMFDFLSSTFKTLSYTSKPIVFFDFGLGIIPNEVRHILEQRCAIVNGWYDEKNRAQIDWSALNSAILEAKNKNFDQKLMEEFYGIQN